MAGQPALSIVVVVVNASRTVRRYLGALAPQLLAVCSEVIMVTSGEVTSDVVSAAREFPFALWVDGPQGALVPELWGFGIQGSRGQVIALTTTGCTPATGWIVAIMSAHRGPYAAVGGPIAGAEKAGILDRAVYLTRYTPYMPPVPSGAVDEVAADNGSYKREAIAEWMAEISERGFWDADINRRLRQKGATLWLDAAVLVVHRDSATLGGFSRQRFSHGRRFGASRRHDMSRAMVWARAAGAPLVPLLMIGRIVSRVRRKTGHRLPFLAALPLVFWFLTCWSAGECVGLIRG
jgi:hypothetical protein